MGKVSDSGTPPPYLPTDTSRPSPADQIQFIANVERIFVSDQDPDLLQLGTEAGLLVDRATSVAVAEWSYGHAERVHAEVWLGGKDYGHLSNAWRELLPV